MRPHESCNVYLEHYYYTTVTEHGLLFIITTNMVPCRSTGLHLCYQW